MMGVKRHWDYKLGERVKVVATGAVGEVLSIYYGPHRTVLVVITDQGCVVVFDDEVEEVGVSKPHPWNLSDTDMPYYNRILNPEEARKKGVDAEIEWVTPDKYMMMAAEAHGVPVAREYAHIIPSLVEKYAVEMSRGAKFPLPVIDYPGRTQEGRQRVEAARRLGYERVPVLVVREWRR